MSAIPLDVYVSPARVSEDDLLAAYKAAARLVARPCACGGVVVADPLDPQYGVRDHQATERHRDWRESWG